MRIGLALGGGGIRGIAHVPVLQVFDDLGIRPTRLAGASMGAVVGALYASGMTARDIRDLVDKYLLVDRSSLRETLQNVPHALRLVESLSQPALRGGLIKADRFVRYLLEEIGRNAFEELEIPLAVIATDAWTGDEVVHEKGPLKPAIQSSMAVPGIFQAVRVGDRILMDGGVVNQVPYDKVREETDYVIAIDVGNRHEPRSTIPGALESVLLTAELMQKARMSERRRMDPPDLYIEMAMPGYRLMDFTKTRDILQIGERNAREVRAFLEKTMRRKRGPNIGRFGRSG